MVPRGDGGAGWMKCPLSAGARDEIRKADFPTRSPGVGRRRDGASAAPVIPLRRPETFPSRRVQRKTLISSRLER